jgi:SAM-dependent methyltransferase
MLRLAWAALFFSAVQTSEWAQIPPAAQELAIQLGIDAANFSRTLTAVDQRTAARLREGELDHMVYYMLQSLSFTPAEPIEPAQSAASYAKARKIPVEVQRRIEAFTAALAEPANERQRYFSNFRGVDIAAEYARAMQFLYRKEVECRDSPNPQSCVASLYSDRGLSSDTSMQSMQAIRAGLDWLKQNKPRASLHRVLIIGPGVDFAPRTALKDEAPPRVYQPAAVAGLLHLESVDCADINPRVIAFAKATCRAIYELNIATRFVPETWDLIIATNVLLYLDDRELLLALNNMRLMLKPGGILLHNDARFSAKLFGKACGLPAIHFGEILLDAHRKPPLTDRFVIHSL